jgi:uncharacterized damage-inducible protein DinB
MTNREFFIKRRDSEYPIFVRVFKALPAERLDYKPEPRSRSAAEIVWLMVLEERSLSEICAAGKTEFRETPPLGSLAAMIAAYEEGHAEVSRQLSKLDEAAWERNAQFYYQGQLAFEAPVGEMFWEFLFDAVHHRGQLSTYIRPMGGKVPSIYGPSADTPAGG